jgi:hypothetical protein
MFTTPLVIETLKNKYFFSSSINILDEWVINIPACPKLKQLTVDAVTKNRVYIFAS